MERRGKEGRRILTPIELFVQVLERLEEKLLVLRGKAGELAPLGRILRHRTGNRDCRPNCRLAPNLTVFCLGWEAGRIYNEGREDSVVLLRGRGSGDRGTTSL